MIVYLVVSYWKSTPLFGVKGERWALFLRASFGFVSLAGNYMAIQMIGLSDASSIVFSAPVFVTFIAFFLLREPLRCTNMLTLVMVIFGIILICKPEILIEKNKVEVIEEESRLIGSVIALIACLANAMTYITLRKLKARLTQGTDLTFCFSVPSRKKLPNLTLSSIFQSRRPAVKSRSSGFPWCRSFSEWP